MKPARFEYVRPARLDEAVRLVGGAPDETAVIAGGQSLLPILALRLTRVGCLVDVSRLDELARCDASARHVTIGAATTHAAIEDGLAPDPGQGVMRRIAARIAYRAVRNQGTIGGSVALADPAADWPAGLIALRATAIIAGPQGGRREPVAGLVRGTYMTSLTPGEIIVGFEVPVLADGARVGISKVVKKTGAFAMSLAIVVLGDGGARVALAGAGGRVLSLAGVGEVLTTWPDASGERLEAALAEDLVGEIDVADAYAARLHRATVMQAVAEARAR